MKLLVVDDDELVLEVLVGCLEDAGFEVTLAVSWEDAIAKASAGVPDVLVTDLDLGGGMSGIDLAFEARRYRPSLPVVYISGRPWLMNSISLRERETFLPKPFRNQDLLDEVRSVAAG